MERRRGDRDSRPRRAPARRELERHHHVRDERRRQQRPHRPQQDRRGAQPARVGVDAPAAREDLQIREHVRQHEAQQHQAAGGADGLLPDARSTEGDDARPWGKRPSAPRAAVCCAGTFCSICSRICRIFAGRTLLDDYARGLRAALCLVGARAARRGLRRARGGRAPARRTPQRPWLSASGHRALGGARLGSGLVLALFVVVHLANLTWGFLHPRFVHLAVHDNVVALLRVPRWSTLLRRRHRRARLCTSRMAPGARRNRSVSHPERGAPRCGDAWPGARPSPSPPDFSAR